MVMVHLPPVRHRLGLRLTSSVGRILGPGWLPSIRCKTKAVPPNLIEGPAKSGQPDVSLGSGQSDAAAGSYPNAAGPGVSNVLAESDVERVTKPASPLGPGRPRLGTV